MSKAPCSIHWQDGQPSLQAVRDKFGLTPEEIDEQFGVVAIDPDEHLYCVLLEEAAVLRIHGSDHAAASLIEGPFANPAIEPFNLKGES
ncbi:MAG: hypothetical protein HYZ50_00885 [Deltaproteobacteria bacterium]|nr:hypothetical protein [Deltaproteobacteria bacterium]